MGLTNLEGFWGPKGLRVGLGLGGLGWLRRVVLEVGLGGLDFFGRGLGGPSIVGAASRRVYEGSICVWGGGGGFGLES